MVYSKALLQICEACDLDHLDEIIIGVLTQVHFCAPERKEQIKAFVPKVGSSPRIAPQKN